MNTYDKSAWEKKTLIKDMVHGYIEVPKPIMKEIVDTQAFQRLKDIEQTGMEALYPAATHKRFLHSLGVYHLAGKAFHEFKKNVETCYPQIYKEIKSDLYQDSGHVWRRWQILFMLAALLHDCGHSPFSHTLEFIYDLREKQEGESLNAKLLKDTSSAFQDDMKKNIDDNGQQLAKPHERMSALLMKEKKDSFRDAIEHLLKDHAGAYGYAYIYEYPEINKLVQEDIEFMMRMVMGCRYDYVERGKYNQREYYAENHQRGWDIELQLRNCIIGMLNSQLDVDNLDYVVRDSKFSGYASHTVDLERLISSFTIVTALEFNEFEIEEEDYLDYCVNLERFEGELVKARITGACYILCKDTNIIAEGRVILQGQEEDTRVKREQRVYQTSDKFSALVSYTQENDSEGRRKAKLVIEKPRNSTRQLQSQYAYLHIRGKMKGKLTGVVFTNGTEGKKWKENGRLKIEFAYEQKCMSVLMSAIYNSNFEKKWIYSHHISTFVNDFLYIYLLEQYSKQFVKVKQYEFLEILNRCIENVKYIKLETEESEINNETEIIELYEFLNAWESLKFLRQKKALKEEIESENKINAIQKDIIQTIKEISRLIQVMGTSEWRNVENDKIVSLTNSLFNIANQCLKERVVLGEARNLREALNFIEKYPQVSIGVLQVYSDILAMYEPFEADKQIFYRTSDRDLLAAYKKLYLEQKDKCDIEFQEFVESYEELITRKYLSCLWKSAPEYEYYFSDWTPEEIKDLKEKMIDRNGTINFAYCVLSDNNEKCGELNSFQLEFWQYMKANWKMDRVVYVKQKIRTKRFVDYDMYMRRGTKVLRLKDVRLFEEDLQDFEFFYIFYRQKEQTEINVSDILLWLKNELKTEKRRGLETEN